MMQSHSLGTIKLIGAGPGDADLLTLKAVKAIQRAEVILVDDLVNPEILEHASQTAKIIPVGKRGGCKSTPQAFIQRLMVSFANKGKQVVRLKGGDPTIFGRAGEELAFIQAAGIEAEIIPGITSACGAAAQLGISLTHREYTPGIAFITGHTQDHAEPDWAPLANSGLTLAIYMGLNRLESITANLIKAGMRADMPVAVVGRATLKDEWRNVATLNTIAAMVAAQDKPGPAVVLVGEAIGVALATALPLLATQAA